MATSNMPCREIAVATVDDASEPEAVAVALPGTQRLKKMGIATLAFGLVASLVLLTWHSRSRPCFKDISEFQQMDARSDVHSRYQAVSRKLHDLGDTMTKLEAQKIVDKTMKLAGERGLARWKANKANHAPDAPVRSLPNNNFPKWVQSAYKPMPAITEERNGVPDRKLPNSFITKQPAGEQAATAMCIFDVLQAFTSLIGFGDDINGMARSCTPPRDAGSQVACQVDAPLMITWMANSATQLSLAASHCAETANIDSICAAGITGLVTVLSEIAGAAALAAPTCASPPPALPTTKISELGDQTLHGKYTGRLLQDAMAGRRLEIAQGAVGNGIQCIVDVSMVAENLADVGLAINQAVNNGFDYCSSKQWDTTANKNGLLQALCTVDIGGVIAYLAQSTTFISLAVVNCADKLDINALCSTSVAGVVTGTSGIAPYGAAIHAACALHDEAYAATHSRRLSEKQSKNPLGRMNKVMDELRSTLARMGHKVPERSSDATPTATGKADLERLVSLVEPAFSEKLAFRGSAQGNCQ
eukprot:TRINITY_DN3645_c0_g1_i1.p1 TRINITY_DN3645_c0_g1~~TRINITY_DN3645_c0_g1_i1.p1  ORF type:complete len:532 (+),score=98.40 TRINITY_DN3645_c0_g1_i1:94-1689(+)